MADKQINLPLTGFEMCGTSVINHWGGGQGTMEMDVVKFKGTKKPTRKMIASEVNDGQFGCESIESAEVTLYAVYGHKFKVYEEDYMFEKKELTKARRGI